MGVPRFAAWLTKKYPEMVSTEVPANAHGLYIDLNGLIHPCCHSDRDPSVALRPEDEKLKCICSEVESLVEIVRPREVLYIAVDGVAPRAKMNQQRSRRYMSHAKKMNSSARIVDDMLKEFTEHEINEVDNDLYDIQESLAHDVLYGESSSCIQETSNACNNNNNNNGNSCGNNVFPPFLLEDSIEEEEEDKENIKQKKNKEVFDSNCISPGTLFMKKVTDSILSMIQNKLSTNDSLWNNLHVIFSGCNTPGEGEHKIINFIRTQSTYRSYNKKGSHVIVGLDADLILLTLSLHLPNMYILRNYKRNAFSSKKHKSKDKKKAKEKEEEGEDEEEKEERDVESYEYFNIDTAGACLVSELHGLCQVKNFTPRSESAFDLCEITSPNGYQFFQYEKEEEEEDKEHEERKREKQKKKKNNNNSAEGEGEGETKRDWRQFRPCTSPANSKIVDDIIVLSFLVGNDFLPRLPSAFCGESALDNLFELYVSDVLPHGFLTDGNHDINISQLHRLMESYEKIETIKFRQFFLKNHNEHNSADHENENESDGKGHAEKLLTLKDISEPLNSSLDEIWREKYLNSTRMKNNIPDACRKYIEGMIFIWRYYSGNIPLCNWSWYYPFHYVPFSADIAKYIKENIINNNNNNNNNNNSRDNRKHQTCREIFPSSVFSETNPPEIFLQLLYILPPASYKLLPGALGNILLHPPAELHEMFPTTWEVDYTSSCGQEHLADVLLPLRINIQKLEEIVDSLRCYLTEEEKERNREVGYHILFSAESSDFKIQGEATEFDSDDMITWNLQEGENGEGRKIKKLHDSLPVRSRPKIYSYKSKIPWVTCNEHGRVHTRERRSRHERRKEKRKHKNDGGSNNNSDNENASESHPLVVINKGPSFSTYLLGFAVLSFVMTITLFPWSLSLLLHVMSVNVVAILFSFFLGIAVHDPIVGSGIRRNNIPMTYVDWLCTECLTANFAVNDKCFVCRAPFDAERCLAVFSGVQTTTPPLYNPDHTPYIETVCLDVPERRQTGDVCGEK